MRCRALAWQPRGDLTWASISPARPKGKVEHLIATYGAERISKPPEAFHDIPEKKALICVVDTVTYETATYCYSAVEMTLLNDSTDFRPRITPCLEGKQ